MTCGEAKYKLDSICKKSNDEMELNECKSQFLEITRNGSVRKIKLPELSKYSSNIYKKSGGDSKELFVIKWGCGRADSVSEAVLYYSIGGGSAPNSEAWASYNEAGILMEDDDKPNPKYDKALKSAEKGMKKVRSIMPD
jgi:hypothetical protein